MDIKKAASKTAALIPTCYDLPVTDDEYGKDHLFEMVEKITTGEITGEKAHRWLGWVQACVCIGSDASLDDLKKINFES